MYGQDFPLIAKIRRSPFDASAVSRRGRRSTVVKMRSGAGTPESTTMTPANWLASLVVHHGLTAPNRHDPSTRTCQGRRGVKLRRPVTPGARRRVSAFLHGSRTRAAKNIVSGSAFRSLRSTRVPSGIRSSGPGLLGALPSSPNSCVTTGGALSGPGNHRATSATSDTERTPSCSTPAPFVLSFAAAARSAGAWTGVDCFGVAPVPTAEQT